MYFRGVKPFKIYNCVCRLVSHIRIVGAGAVARLSVNTVDIANNSDTSCVSSSPLCSCRGHEASINTLTLLILLVNAVSAGIVSCARARLHNSYKLQVFHANHISA